MQKPLKAAVIGSGMIAGTHVTAMRKAGIEVVGIYSQDSVSAVQLAGKYKIKAYGSMSELLTDDTDLAAICTPSGTHAELALTLLEHGKHAVVEKPAALTEEDGYRLIDGEKRFGKSCIPISQLRFSEAYRDLKTAVDGGDFGKILLGTLSMKYYRSPEYFAGSWRGTKAMDGGGALMNQGIHGVDVLCGLLGYPTRISGHIATLCHGIEVEDTAVASLVFPSGALGVIDAGTAIQYPKPRRLVICGTKASAAMEEDRILSSEGITLSECGKSASRAWQNPAEIGDTLHAAQYRNVASAIRGQEPLFYTLHDAVNTVRVILAIYRSSDEGITIPFQPISLRPYKEERS